MYIFLFVIVIANYTIVNFFNACRMCEAYLTSIGKRGMRRQISEATFMVYEACPASIAIFWHYTQN
jgi:hypothetical protein